MKHLKLFNESKDLNTRINDYLNKMLPGEGDLDDRVTKFLNDSMVKCPLCNKKFLPTSKNPKYCCDKCERKAK
jgi:hypothetical protein